MTVLLALAASVVYGVGDFCGGFASRRAAAASVLLLGAPVATVLLVGAALLVGGPVTSSVVAGGAAGLGGSLAVLVFYRALAVGTMSVVSPVTAVTSAAVPLVVGVGLLGERLALPAVLGVLASLAAVVLVGLEPATPDAPAGGRRAGRGVGLALLAGTGFGLFFVGLSAAPSDAGLWPVVWARVVTIAVVVVAARATGAFTLPRGSTALWSLAAGLLDATANVLVLLAFRDGELAVPSVLISLYPAATVLLAAVVLGERLARLQQVGLGAAAAGVVLLSV